MAAKLTDTDRKDNTSLVAKDNDVVGGVPVDDYADSILIEKDEEPVPPSVAAAAADANRMNTEGAGAGAAGGQVLPPDGWAAGATTEGAAADAATAAGREGLYERTSALTRAAQDVLNQPSNVETPQRTTTYEDLFRKLNPDPTPSPEDLVAEAKRNKRNKTIAALGDFATALANMGGTMAGAPNQKMSTTAQEAYAKEIERLRKIRVDNAANWDKALAREQARDDKNYALRLSDSQKRVAAEQRQRESASKLLLNIATALQKADEAEQKGDLEKARIMKAQADADYAEARAKGYDRLLDASIRQKLAAANNSNAHAATAGSSGGGRGGSRSQKTLNLEDGAHTYSDINDYKKAVLRAAGEMGINSRLGNGRTIDHVAAEVEAEAARRAAEKRNQQPKAEAPKPKSEQKPAASGKKKIGWKK